MLPSEGRRRCIINRELGGLYRFRIRPLNQLRWTLLLGWALECNFSKVVDKYLEEYGRIKYRLNSQLLLRWQEAHPLILCSSTLVTHERWILCFRNKHPTLKPSVVSHTKITHMQCLAHSTMPHLSWSSLLWREVLLITLWALTWKCHRLLLK